MHRSPHEEGTAWIAGAKALVLTEFEAEGESATGFGFGVSCERNVVHGWLEIEAVLSAAHVEETWLLPIDLLFKKPFHFGHVQPYIGVGPAMTLNADHLDEPAFGAAFALGAYLWFGDHAGLDVELSYSIVSEAAIIQEFIVAVGPAVRF